MIPETPPVVVDAEATEISTDRIQIELRAFQEALKALNKQWEKAVSSNRALLPQYVNWARAAGPMYGQVIPSMAFDIQHMDQSSIEARFRMIRKVVRKILLVSPVTTKANG